MQPGGPLFETLSGPPPMGSVPPVATASPVALQPSPQAAPRRGRMIVSVVGVGALLAAGAFAFTQMRSNDGGAASAQELGQQLVNAMNNEDALGAVDLLLPGERETFRQPMIDYVAELARLDLLAENVNLNDFSGIDIQIDAPQVTVTPTNVTDISKVHIQGDARVITKSDELPIGEIFIDRYEIDDEMPEDVDAVEPLDMTFAAVEKDGRWYASLMYTVAEEARGDEDVPQNPVQPIGADSPEAAMDAMIAAISDLRVADMIARLNPNEAEALQRYAPLFLDEAQATINDETANMGFEMSIDDTEYKVFGDGDRRHVQITKAHFSASGDGESVELTLEGNCVKGTIAGEPFEQCSNGDGSEIDGLIEQMGFDDSDGEIQQFINDLTAAFADMEPIGITVAKVGDGWYVSPIGTYSDLGLSVLRALTREELDTLLDSGEAAVAAIGDGMFGSFDEEFSDDGSLENYDTWTDCVFDAADSAAGSACIEDKIATGNVEADFVPAPYRYPECGLYEYYDSDELYSDSGAEFYAAVSGAAPCIQQAAEADGMDLSFMTVELLKPECFQTINPYNTFDAVQADVDAAWACAYE